MVGVDRLEHKHMCIGEQLEAEASETHDAYREDPGEKRTENELDWLKRLEINNLIQTIYLL